MHDIAERDLELEQCYARFVVSGLILAWSIYWFIHVHSNIAQSAIIIVVGFVLFSMLHWYNVKKYPGYYPKRRVMTLFADHGTCVALMMVTGEMATFAIFVSVFVTLGTGFRFGLKWMMLSVFVASLSMLFLGIYGGYWEEHPVLVVSLFMLNIIIPLYVAVLIRGIEEAREKLSQYAGVMEKMALRDSLTGLPNRYALYEDIERSCATAKRHDLSVAIFYFDLDGFKKVNDTHGHTVGDMLLKEVSCRVSGVLRTEDVLARLGGDEFVAVLHMNDAKECSSFSTEKAIEYAEVLANRILESILSIETINGLPIEVSASLGGVVVKGFDAVALGYEKLVHAADKNMYAAKNAGKNRVVLTDVLK